MEYKLFVRIFQYYRIFLDNFTPHTLLQKKSICQAQPSQKRWGTEEPSQSPRNCNNISLKIIIFDTFMGKFNVEIAILCENMCQEGSESKFCSEGGLNV